MKATQISGMALQKKAWSVIAFAVIVLLTAVCGIGGYRGPHVPQPIRPVISTALPDPVGVSPNGLKIVSWDRELHRSMVFETHANATPVVLNLSHCVFRLLDAQFSWDGKQIAGGCTAFDLTVWNAVTGEAINHLRCRVSPYFVAAWSRDGHYLAAACELEKVTVWELSSGKEIATFRPHNGTVSQLAFTPQGQLVSSGSDGWVRFGDLSGHVSRSHEFGDMVKGFILRSDGR
jgi:WD40 repeat protein